MAISSADLVKYRTSQNQTLEPTLVVVPTTVVGTADVQAAPTTYPAASISITNLSGGFTSSVKVGHFFKIENPTNGIVTWGVVRKAPTAGTLFIDAKAQGDPGISTPIHLTIQAGDNITVYQIRPLWTLLSRISGGVFFKKFDFAYDGSGSNPNPVVNIGEHQIIIVDKSGGEGTVNLDATNSFTWQNKTLTTFLWTLPGSATILSGTVNDSSLTISLSQGYHEVECKITDSGGATFTGLRSIWVVGDSFQPLSSQFGLESAGGEQGLRSTEMTFKIYGENLDENVILPGAMVAFTDRPLYDGVPVSGDEINDYFVGFVGDRIEVYEDGVTGEKSVQFTAISPAGWLEKIPQVSQVIVEEASPNAWEEVSRGLGDVNFSVWYILKHHTTFLEMFDFYRLPDAVPPRKRAWGFNGSNIAQQLAEVEDSFQGNIGSSYNGALYMRRDPRIESNSFRDSLDDLLTWVESDLTEEVQITRKFLNSVAFVRLYVLSMQSNNETEAYASIAPGLQQGQAGGASEYDNVLLPPQSGQNECNILSGHIYARENAPISDISLSVMRNFDVADPAKMVWHTIDISAAASPTGKRLFHRCLPKSVSRTWEQTDSGAWVKTIEIAFNIETFGQPGVKLPIDPGDGLNFPAFPPFEIPQGVFPPTGVAGGVGGSDTSELLKGTAIVSNEEGNAALTRSFNNSSPGWDNLNDYVTGNIADYDWDYASTYFQTGIKTDTVGIYIVTQESTNFRVYHMPDISNPSGVSLLDTSSMADSTATTNGVVSCSKGNPNLIIAAWKDGTGTRFVRSGDGGSSWSAPAYVTSSISDVVSNDNAFIGLDTFDNNQIITAPDVTPEYGSYLATAVAGSFSEISGTPRKVHPFPMSNIGSSLSAYVSAIDQFPGAAIENIISVTFDPGGYIGYSLSTGAGDTTTDTGTGFSGNCAEADDTGGNDILKLEVNFDFTDINTPDIETVEFRWRMDHDSSGTFNPVLTIVDGLGTHISTGANQTADGVWRNILFRPTGGSQTPINDTEENTEIFDSSFLPASDYTSITVSAAGAAIGASSLTIRIDDIQIKSSSVEVSTVDFDEPDAGWSILDFNDFADQNFVVESSEWAGDGVVFLSWNAQTPSIGGGGLSGDAFLLAETGDRGVDWVPHNETFLITGGLVDSTGGSGGAFAGGERHYVINNVIYNWYSDSSNPDPGNVGVYVVLRDSASLDIEIWEKDTPQTAAWETVDWSVDMVDTEFSNLPLLGSLVIAGASGPVQRTGNSADIDLRADNVLIIYGDTVKINFGGVGITEEWSDYLTSDVNLTSATTDTGGNPDGNFAATALDSSQTTAELTTTFFFFPKIEISDVFADFYIDESVSSGTVVSTAVRVKIGEFGETPIYNQIIHTGLPVNGTWTTVRASTGSEGNWSSNIDIDIPIPQFSVAQYEMVVTLEIEYSSAGPDTVDIRMDNVGMNVPPPGKADIEVGTLYRVDDYDGTPTWTDITPANGVPPDTPYGLSVNTQSLSQINVVSGQPGDKTWYRSNNAGNVWIAQEASTTKESAEQRGTIYVSSGTQGVFVQTSPDFEEFDKTGNLQNALGGSLGTPKKILIL